MNNNYKYNTIFLLLVGLLSISSDLSANDADSVAWQKDLSEVSVVTGKLNNRYHENVSVTKVGIDFIDRNHIEDTRQLSSVVPNMFMPDYGSKQNSPVYIRGIGSKMNAPSVAMYIDGVPLFENSSFDIPLVNIGSVSVLRGPQGSLYGRNAIGGIISVTTLSPLQYQATRVCAGYGNHNDAQVSALHYAKMAENVGLGVSLYAHHNDGSFRNVTLNRKIDNINNGNGRVALEWQTTDRLNIRLNSFFNYTKQGGYPYGEYDASTGRTATPSYDGHSSYRRALSTTGLSIAYSGYNVRLTSQTSVHYSNDHQAMDQDFTPSPNIFLHNRNSLLMISEELMLKSETERRYQWLVGAFAFHQNLDKRTETQYLTKDYANLKHYKTPTTAFAVYHQSTVKIGRGVSAVFGVRYDFEKTTNDMETEKRVISTDEVGDGGSPFNATLSYNQVTPRLSVQYKAQNNTYYASVSRGYKAGGFNNTAKDEDNRTFKPEYNWNYEAGVKFNIPAFYCRGEVSLFYIDWKGQQVSQVVPGVGSLTKNAGHSVSKGVEFSASVQPVTNLSLMFNYGYTHAKFTNYVKDEKTDCSGNYIPMVPRQTMMVAGNYAWQNLCTALDRLTVNVSATGAGPIYWREENTEKQSFYAQLSASVKATAGKVSVEFWGKNITDTDYVVYCFSYNKLFAQKGKPVQLGVTVSLDI